MAPIIAMQSREWGRAACGGASATVGTAFVEAITPVLARSRFCATSVLACWSPSASSIRAIGASNLAAGSVFGYSLIWVVSLGTLMLMVLQHNAAHLGIATGYCLSEAATIYLPRRASVPILGSAVAAAISTALAEVLGAAIAVNLLTGLPLRPAIVLACAFTVFMLFSNSYRKLEKWIIGFVSLIVLSLSCSSWRS